MSIFPYDKEAPLLGVPIDTVIRHTPRPVCRCVTFFQFYLCGCPDLGVVFQNLSLSTKPWLSAGFGASGSM